MSAKFRVAVTNRETEMRGEGKATEPETRESGRRREVVGDRERDRQTETGTGTETETERQRDRHTQRETER